MKSTLLNATTFVMLVSQFAICAAADEPIAQTAEGTFVGLVTERGEEFLGVPYAKAPVGDLRWKAPEKMATWQGARDAKTLPPACPQKFNADQRVSLSQSEDCLFLNIYRPKDSAGKNLPVAVWLHGGGNTNGSGSNHDGGAMAERNGIVVLTLNHRLGALGFLNHPALQKEAKDGLAGNYGIADIKAALIWVTDKISGFGGDPKKVTVFGESSGATNICAMAVTSAGVQGLYRGQIIESDDCFHDMETAESSEVKAVKWSEQMGCKASEDAASCLRKKSVDEIIAAGGRWFPQVDAKGLLTEYGVDGIASGNFLKIPTIIGSNREEGRNAGPSYFKFTQSDYLKWVEQIGAPDRAERILEKYPANLHTDKKHPIAEVVTDVITDSGMRGLGGCTVRDAAIKLSRIAPTYYYQFDDPGAPVTNEVEGWKFGAAHGAEVPYLFPRHDGIDEASRKFDAGQRQLSDDMIRYWGAFVRSGAPRVDGLPDWPQFGKEQKAMMLRPAGKSGIVTSEEISKDHQCDFWTSMPWITDRG